MAGGEQHIVSDHGAAGRIGQPEVNQPDCSGGDHLIRCDIVQDHIAGRDVAVYQPGVVGCLQAAQKPIHDRRRLIRAHRPTLGHPFGHGGPVNRLQGDPGPRRRTNIAQAAGIYRSNIGLVHLGEASGFTQKGLPERLVLTQGRVQHLQRDDPRLALRIELTEILTAVDRRGAASTEELTDLEPAAEQCRLRPVGRAGHDAAAA